MKIKELQVNQANVDIVLDIIEAGNARTFSKFGKPGRVANATGTDEAGDKIKISLWNEQIDKIDKGDKIHIKNGYVGEWQGEKQLSTGRNGTLEIVKKGPGPEPVPGTQEPGGTEETEEDYKKQEETEDDFDVEEEYVK